MATENMNNSTKEHKRNVTIKEEKVEGEKKEKKNRLLDYTSSCNIHGFNHLNPSKSCTNKLFWVLAILVSVGFCCFHIFKTINNFMESPISSTYFMDSVQAEFPDVTLCNQQSISLFAMQNYKKYLNDYLEKEWKFFDNYYDIIQDVVYEEKNITRKSKRRRHKSDWDSNNMGTYLNILWASDDLRDFGQSDTTFLVYCVYNSRRCSTKEFKLMQNSKYWNCYKFTPKERTVTASQGTQSGLFMVFYTDSISHHDLTSTKQLKYNEHDKNKYKHVNYYSMRDFFKIETDLNKIRQQILATSGFQIYVQKEKGYPFSSPLSYPISAGQMTNVYFTQTNYKLVNLEENPCSEEIKTIDYVRYFGANSTHVGRKSFQLTEAEVILNMKQDFIYKKCGCYSHHYPIQTEPKDWCYFIPKKYGIKPKKEFIKKIRCHDKAFYEVESETSHGTSNEAKSSRPCEHIRYSTQLTSSTWPKDTNLKSFVKILTGMNKYMKKKEVHKHQILTNVTDVHSQVLKTLLTNVCDSNWNAGTNTTKKRRERKWDEWCTTPELIRGNYAALQVRPKFPTATQYKESITYQWPEVLSEIGGTLGLWMGMSLLTIVELLEVLTSFCSNKKKDEHGHSHECHHENNNAKLSNLPLMVEFDMGNSK